FVSPSNARRSKRPVSDRAGGHVAAKDFAAIQINDCAIIAQKRNCQITVACRVRHGERATEPGRDVLVIGVCSIPHERGLIAISITELRPPHSPGRIIEGQSAPANCLVRSIIQIPPVGAGRNKNRTLRDSSQSKYRYEHDSAEKGNSTLLLFAADGL